MEELVKDELSNDPIIYTIDNFLDKDTCDHFIKLGEPKLHESLVSGNQKGYVSNGRTGLNCWIPHDHDLIAKNVADSISNLVGVPLENAEAFQVIYYDKTQEYRQHYDGWLLDGSERSVRNMKYGGQRLWTALCYLNDVEAGGSTKFTKLKKDVFPKKGKLLVFSNVHEGTNKRHDMTEHAGTPVIEGQKWAFNLWFREKSRKEIYNYEEGQKKQQEQESDASLIAGIAEQATSNWKPNLQQNKQLDLTNLYKNKAPSINFSIEKNIKPIENDPDKSKSNITLKKGILNMDDIFSLLKLVNFENKERSVNWIDNQSIKNLIKKLSDLVGINSCYFENLCITNYKSGKYHNDHLDAYDLNSEKGKEYTDELGQRLMTITGFLSPTVVNFPKLKENFTCGKGDLLFYNNCIGDTNIREPKYIKSYNPLNKSNDMTLFNIYVREKSKTKNNILKINNDVKIEEIIPEKPKEPLDYPAIISNIYEKPLIITLRNKDFKMVNKAPPEFTIETLKGIKNLRMNEGFLNQQNLDKEYKLDEDNPVVVEDVITPNIHQLVDTYIKENIKNGVYPLGDRQANRYKVIDDVVTRLLHIEFLPLIEKITGKKMEPTYTYLAAYLKGTNLHAHTDRPECQYTCSYIIGKPKDSSWNIYIHKIKQPIKNHGRYDFTPPKDECIPVDCAENGLMIFCGTDHIHYREELEYDYYNIVLLHYKEGELLGETRLQHPP